VIPLPQQAQPRHPDEHQPGSAGRRHTGGTPGGLRRCRPRWCPRRRSGRGTRDAQGVPLPQGGAAGLAQGAMGQGGSQGVPQGMQGTGVPQGPQLLPQGTLQVGQGRGQGLVRGPQGFPQALVQAGMAQPQGFPASGPGAAMGMPGSHTMAMMHSGVRRRHEQGAHGGDFGRAHACGSPRAHHAPHAAHGAQEQPWDGARHSGGSRGGACGGDAGPGAGGRGGGGRWRWRWGYAASVREPGDHGRRTHARCHASKDLRAWCAPGERRGVAGAYHGMAGAKRPGIAGPQQGMGTPGVHPGSSGGAVQGPGEPCARACWDVRRPGWRSDGWRADGPCGVPGSDGREPLGGPPQGNFP